MDGKSNLKPGRYIEMSKIRCLAIAKELLYIIKPVVNKRKLQHEKNEVEKWGKRKKQNKTYFNSLTAVKIIYPKDINESQSKKGLDRLKNGLVTNTNFYTILPGTENMVIAKRGNNKLYIADFLTLYPKTWLSNTVIDYLCSNLSSTYVPCDLATVSLDEEIYKDSNIFQINLFKTKFM